MGDSDIVDEFSFAKDSNVWWEIICSFKAIEEVLTGVEGDEYFNVVKEVDGASIV